MDAPIRIDGSDGARWRTAAPEGLKYGGGFYMLLSHASVSWEKLRPLVVNLFLD